MKTIKATVAILFAIVGTAVAQEKSWWTDFSVSPFGAVTHPNFGSPEYGAGLDVGYNINKTVSLHVANLAYETCDWKGSAIDETSLLFRADLVRYSKERLVLFVLGGGDRDWGRSDWAFGVGVGAELRLAKNVSIGVDSRIRSWFKNDKDVTTRGFVGFRF